MSEYRFALEVEYDGSGFAGWQKQAIVGIATVQDELERAISKVADRKISLFCAGRTDRGVHATGQIVHFDCDIDRGSKAWVVGVNSLLPDAIRVKWSQLVSCDFHARFSAIARRYIYVIYDAKVAPALMRKQLTYTNHTLDIELMQEAGQYLLGENDFSAFRAAGCQSRTANRFIHWLTVYRLNRYIVVDIQANAFLQHMVRNIVGMLIDVGSGNSDPGWALTLLTSRDRTQGGVTAPAEGLYLIKVSYPETAGLPQTELGPSFLQPIHRL